MTSRWWLVGLAALAGCADIIAAGDLRRVDCVGLCEETTGGQGGGLGGASTTTGDASSEARAGTSSGGGSGGSRGTAGTGGVHDAGDETILAGTTGAGGVSGAGGSLDIDGSAGAAGQAGTTGAGGAAGAGVGGAGGNGGGPIGCPAGGWPAGWVCVRSGSFTMGSPLGEIGRDSMERPHVVTITRPFWMQVTEASQSDWQAVTGNNPSSHRNCGSSCPVESVNWFSAVLYANALSMRDGYTPCYEKANGIPFDAAAALAKQTPSWRLGLACPGYRLPTEAEWEYAARAGTTTGFFSGDPTTSNCMPLDASLDVAGWYCANAGNTPHTARVKSANDWGLYDMHGNVWEWVWDWSAPYGAGPVTDPTGPSSGTQRQIRGGSFYSAAQYCRSAARGPTPPDSSYDDTGVRLVRSIP